MALRSFICLFLFILTVPIGSAKTQPSVQGRWGPHFQHDVSPATLPAPPLDLYWQPPILVCETIPWEDFSAPGWKYNPEAVAQTTVCFNAIHMALIPKGPNQGKVLVFDSTREHECPPAARCAPFHAQRWAIVDPEASPRPLFKNHVLQIPMSKGGDLFCAGHAWDQDGNLFTAGGSNYQMTPIGGLKIAYLFDPADPTETADGSWLPLPDMNIARWYPTVTLLGDSKNLVVVTGGVNNAGAVTPPFDTAYNTYEVYDPSLALPAWEPEVHNGPRWVMFPPNWNTVHPLGYYPRMFALSELAFGGTPTNPNSRLFMSGMYTKSASLDHPTAPGDWGPSPKAPEPVHNTGTSLKRYGSAVLVPGQPDAIMHMGGEETGTTHNSVEFIDTRQPNPTWISQPTPGSIPNMLKKRWVFNSVLLPDASVLVTGGASAHAYQAKWRDEVIIPQHTPELLKNNSWTPMAREFSPRLYHSTAVLLPSGRVLSGGGDVTTNSPGRVPPRFSDYQVFSPPYLFAGYRPTWGSAPEAVMSYGQHHTVTHTTEGGLPSGVNIDKVVLMAPGSVTHHCDMHQRYVALTVTAMTPSSITFTTPPNATYAPRGYYMVFLVTNTGIPSVAKFVQLK